MNALRNLGKDSVALICLLAAGAGTTQENAEQVRIAELIQQLDDPDPLRRDAAVHRLVAFGRPAAAALRKRIEHAVPDAAAVRALGKMGPDAVDCLETLLDELAEPQQEEVTIALQYAVLGILPFFDQTEPATSVEAALAERERLILAQVARRGQRLEPEDRAGIERSELMLEATLSVYQLGWYPSEPGELVERVEATAASRPQRVVGAAAILGRSGSRDPAARKALQSFLIDPRTQVDPQLLAPFAEAILRLDPQSDEAMDAQAWLLRRGDVYQRHSAAVALRSFGDRVGRVVESILPALRDDSLDPRTLGELIVTAGIIGPHALAGVRRRLAEELVELTEGEPQIAARAQAALRQLRQK